MDIVNHREGDTPPPTAFVIHVRAGDVIDGVGDSLLDLLMLSVAWHRAGPQRGIREAATSWSEWARANPRADESNWWNYVKTLNYYEAIVQNGLPAGARSIVLVTGSHWPLSADGVNHFFDENGNTGTLGSFERSWKYLHVIKGLYEELGFPTTLRMGYSPDDDFVYMGSARYFHPTGGGFSRLVASVVKRKGGQVISSRAVNVHDGCGEYTVDLWPESLAWGPNAARGCTDWSTNNVWGALKDGSSLAHACMTSWARENCAALCCECCGSSPHLPPPS